MDEFLKLKWRIKDASELEKQPYFIANDHLTDLYIYKHLEKKIDRGEKVRVHQVQKVIPGPLLESPQNKSSFLDQWQQEQCLKALKLHQSGKDPFTYTAKEKLSIKTYNELQSKIIDENRRYLASVKEAWESQTDSKLRIKPKLFNYAKKQFKKKLDKFFMYPQYYKQTELFNMCFNEQESETECKHVMNLLEVGTLARFVAPNLKAKCLLKVGNIASDDTVITNSKLPVSLDENINRLIANTDIDVIISSGGLKTILDPTNVRKEWTIPVVIRKMRVPGDANERLKKIVYIDNPLPKKNPDILDYSYFCHKMLLRSEFCQYEAFAFPNEDLPIQEAQAELGKIMAPSEQRSNENEQSIDETGEPPTKQMKTQKNNAHHNVSYRLWTIKKKSLLNTLSKHKTKDVTINLLVRSKLDGCEKTEHGQLQPVIVRPKLEFQLQYGASIPSKMELSREWTSLYFRPFSNLCRVRVDSSRSEVVSVEKCSIQKIITEALTLYDFRPNLGLGILQKLLQDLTETEAEGKYVLRHVPKDGTFVALMKECNEKSSDTFDLHSQIEQCTFVERTTYNPLPIDINCILPAHEASNRMPGMFRPFVKKKKGAKKKGKKKAKQKAQKASKNETKTSV